jgi:hypothetical protein
MKHSSAGSGAKALEVGGSKSDSLEVLLRFSEEHWEEIRHIENQRAAITNLVILVASASVGLASQKGLSISQPPLAGLIVFVGGYGLVSTAKLHERYRYLQARLDKFYEKIEILAPEAEFERLRRDAHEEHISKFPRLSVLPVYRLWMALHSAILGLGIVLLLRAL